MKDLKTVPVFQRGSGHVLQFKTHIIRGPRTRWLDNIHSLRRSYLQMELLSVMDVVSDKTL